MMMTWPPVAHKQALFVVQVLHEPCYDTLRTKQQLGYSVHSGVRLTHGILGFAVCIVSGTCKKDKFVKAIRRCYESGTHRSRLNFDQLDRVLYNLKHT